MVAAASWPRTSVDGKFFRLGEKKFHVKGVAYGPFQPNSAGQHFLSPEQTAADFEHIRAMGANVVRIYEIPGKWFLDLALEHRLLVLVDIPWNQHLCFLDYPDQTAAALDAIRRAVYACARHPAVFAFSVANEIPSDVVRWTGAERVASFIERLVAEAKRIDPACLCTFTNYPSTEFLQVRSIDFVCFNVYLHQEQGFQNYLARLQMLADGKPLLLGETGVDAMREGEERQATILDWQIEHSFRYGLAGIVVFRYTDEWWRGGHEVTDWEMGLTRRDRVPRPAYERVRAAFQAAPYFPLSRYPRVSVVVASYNADRTLRGCLESLGHLNYPDYEVILVDDGSSDATAQVVFMHPHVRCIRHERNKGLSVARNTGIAAATGEIVAFTDADCRADSDWLHYLVGNLLSSDFAGIGGPNLLPPEDSFVAAAVMASPGGPAHVMLTDRQAEHIPGCNMAFYRDALLAIGGFDPVFTKAGDDVDVCWRLQQSGLKIGFSPSGFVWHYRRSTVQAYLKQQHGYGEAEAMLVCKHPEYFNSIGGSMWKGRIYSSSNLGVLLRKPIIYRGWFGSAGYQSIYASDPASMLMLATSLEYHVFVTLPLWVLTVSVHLLWPLAAASLLLSLLVCAAAATQAHLPANRSAWWSRPLVALLFFLQPIVRGWARYRGRLLMRPTPMAQPSLDSIALRSSDQDLSHRAYWSDQHRNRLEVVQDILARMEMQGWPHRADSGWSDYDIEVYGSRWSHLQLTTAGEDHPKGKQLLRFRLRSRWSFIAGTTFWTLCVLEALMLGFFLPERPWLWSILVLPPALVWLFRRQQRTLQSMIAALLDEYARDKAMHRL